MLICSQRTCLNVCMEVCLQCSEKRWFQGFSLVKELYTSLLFLLFSPPVSRMLHPLLLLSSISFSPCIINSLLYIPISVFILLTLHPFCLASESSCWCCSSHLTQLTISVGGQICQRDPVNGNCALETAPLGGYWAPSARLLERGVNTIS